ncbi:hypothetical protein [Kordia sp.]|uniref:hypothetical protein n=1 Tax=Kordia sp. TaxID=1965332 RepID=UPI003D265440
MEKGNYLKTKLIILIAQLFVIVGFAQNFSDNGLNLHVISTKPCTAIDGKLVLQFTPQENYVVVIKHQYHLGNFLNFSTYHKQEQLLQN